MTVKRTVPAHFAHAFERFGDRVVLLDREGDVTRKQVMDDAAAMAEGLRKAGVSPGDRVGFYADNSRRWIVADLAVHLAGGVSVPRGTDTPVPEMIELFEHAEVGLVLAHAGKHATALDAARSGAPTMGEIVSLDPKDAPGRTMDDLIAEGRGGPSFAEAALRAEPGDLATIIYTSGTTGRPKGVMLTQGNFAHQIECCPAILTIQANERFLSILPPWHIFERTVEYIALCSGCELAYTDRRRFRDDLAKRAPTFVPSVPRIWETVYDTVQKQLAKSSVVKRTLFRAAYAVSAGRHSAWDRARSHVLRVHEPRGIGWLGEIASRAIGFVVSALLYLPDRLGNAVVLSKLKRITGGHLRGAISGGGLMPLHVDRFLRAIGVPILVGYGLTETSPVVTLRRIDRNVLGSIGPAVPETEVRILDLETREPLPPGAKGLIVTRGPQVMSGYYKDDELTAKVIDEDGWFDTGDLGYLTEKGDLCFAGRAKETIVLRGGENVEPGAIEEAIVASPLVEQVLVVGQDQKVLAALVLPDPDGVATVLGLERLGHADLAAREDVLECLTKECRQRTARLKPYERILRIAILPEPLTIENGCITQTLKPRRHVIVERFAAQIEEAYAG